MINVDVVGDFFTSDNGIFRQGSSVQVENLINYLHPLANFTLFEMGKSYPLKRIGSVKICGFQTIEDAVPFLHGEILHYNNICYYTPTNASKIVTGTIHTNVFIHKMDARFQLERIIHGFDRIFVVNTQCHDSLSGFGNIQLVYNGIDVDLFKYQPAKLKNDSVKILFPNRNEAVKNREFAIDLIKDLNRKYPARQFRISMMTGNDGGKNPYIDYFEEKESPSEMHQLYCQHSITIIPSLSESCSMCALEAMASGSVVFYNTLPSVHDYVDNTGFMIDVKKLSRWSQQIGRITSHPSEFEKTRNLAHERVANLFPASRMAREYYNAWVKLLKRR